MSDREAARVAAAAIRKALTDPSDIGERSVVHLDLSRPRRGEWWETWANLPGFTRINGNRFTHALLPGWEYTSEEVRSEMIPDLEKLAETGELPKEATR